MTVQSVQARADLRGDEGRRRLGAAVGHDQREGVFVPGGDEAEHRGGRDAGRRLGQHDLEEGLHARVAVDQRRLLVLLRDLVHEALHQPDREGQVEGGVEDDQADMRVVEADGAVHQEHRDGDDDRRQHARRQDEEEQVGLARHPEAREAVGGERAHADGEHGAGDRDDQAVEEAVRDIATAGRCRLPSQRRARRRRRCAAPTRARRRRPPGRPACVSCTRLVNSLTNGVISGWKKTVGGTVVARLRGLKAVEAIQ